jgi:hypothetical protein
MVDSTDTTCVCHIEPASYKYSYRYIHQSCLSTSVYAHTIFSVFYVVVFCQRDGGEEKQDEGRADEPQQRLVVGEGSAEEDDRLVRGAEEVEEAPSGEEAQEDEGQEGVRQERGPQREGDHGGVVDAEVSEVATQAGGGVGERVWLRERRTVEELSPRPTIRQRASRRVGDPAQEEPESRRSDRRIGASGGGQGQSGRRVGHREEGRRRRCGGHGVGDSEIRRVRV